MSWSANVPVSAEMREAFVQEYLKNGRDHFEAGKSIYPRDRDKGLALGMELITNPLVQARIGELQTSTPARAFLPTKEDVARELWNTIQGKHPTRKFDGRDLLAAIRLYAELMSMIERPQQGMVVGVTGENNKVMIVHSHGTDEEWEVQAKRQQAKLIADANAE